MFINITSSVCIYLKKKGYFMICHNVSSTELILYLKYLFKSLGLYIFHSVSEFLIKVYFLELIYFKLL